MRSLPGSARLDVEREWCAAMAEPRQGEARVALREALLRPLEEEVAATVLSAAESAEAAVLAAAEGSVLPRDAHEGLHTAP